MDSLRYSDVVYVSIDRLGWLTMMTGNGFAMIVVECIGGWFNALVFGVVTMRRGNGRTQIEARL